MVRCFKLGDSMDFKVSKKETRRQPEGLVDVLVNNVCDLYPIFADDPRFKDVEICGVSESDRKNLIMDVEILDNDKEERLDRAMFAAIKQRGNDPVEPADGIQWAEAVLGEVLSPNILQQVYSSVLTEGTGVRVTPNTIKNGTKEYLTFRLDLTD